MIKRYLKQWQKKSASRRTQSDIHSDHPLISEWLFFAVAASVNADKGGAMIWHTFILQRNKSNGLIPWIW